MDYNWLTPKAQMRVTPGKGSGSFAISKILKGEIVASFGGHVIHQTELIKTLESYRFTVIPLELRHSRTLGGGFHCVTLDLIRQARS